MLVSGSSSVLVVLLGARHKVVSSAAHRRRLGQLTAALYDCLLALLYTLYLLMLSCLALGLFRLQEVFWLKLIQGIFRLIRDRYLWIISESNVT